MNCKYCNKERNQGHHCSGNDAFTFGKEQTIDELIGKAISIQTEEELWRDEIEEFTKIKLLTKEWNKLKENGKK